jgi:hypothetical protein
MKLYIKAISSYRSDKDESNLKQVLKQQYKVDVRRKDDFIYAGLYGALRLQEKVSIERDNELYLTSGFGNLNILAKMHKYMIENKEPIKLFDFINMLGNTTSFYVASMLGIKAKTLFQISDNFTFFHTLIMIYASLQKSKNEAILGTIDIVSENEEVLKRIAGIEEKTSLVSAVHYQKISLNPKDALCVLEFDTKFYTLEEVKKIIENTNLHVRFSSRCQALHKEGKPYFETDVVEVIYNAIQNNEQTLYVECYGQRYKLLYQFQL